MKTFLHSRPGRHAMLMMDLMVAMGILVIAIIPVGYACVSEQKMARASYHRAVAMEIVDGEMEVLAAGEWRHQPEGTRAMTVRAAAAGNLPRGEFQLTRSGNRLRLEWIPQGHDQGGHVWREVSGR